MGRYINSLKSIVIVLTVFLCSCNFSGSMKYENEEIEKERAAEVTGLFFSCFQQHDYQKCTSLFGSGFFKVTSEKELLKILKDIDASYGELEDLKLIDWKTNRIVGSGAKSEYLLTYEVDYKSLKSLQQFSLVKEENQIKIFGYDFKKMPADN